MIKGYKVGIIFKNERERERDEYTRVGSVLKEKEKFGVV